MQFALAEVRRQRGVSLEEVASATRISMRFLEAIEAGEFRKLPGGVFTINYLQQYARFVGVDEGALLDRCRRSLEPETGSSPELRDEDLRVPWLPKIRIRIVWTGLFRWLAVGFRKRASRDFSL